MSYRESKSSCFTQKAVAQSLTLKPAARLNPVEIAIDVELQQDRRMIRRPTGDLRIDTAKPKITKIKFINEDVDHPNGIILNSTHISGTHVPVGEPSTASKADLGG